MRGKPGLRAPRALRGGLIPARAGKTPSHRRPASAGGAHPRACGENCPDSQVSPTRGGSSPRVRGKRALVLDCDFEGRLIPARAGKTFVGCTSSPSGSAHPRACGENPAFTAMLAMLAGSSPRVRGKHSRGGGADHFSRLIPARAGKTCGGARSRSPPGAHPRACGENDGGFVAPLVVEGSSPRVRGKRALVLDCDFEGRLIPARAGKTFVGCTSSPSGSAHPRACGENSSVRAPVPATTGSSPRVRGKLLQASLALARLRLIPARAGKT